MNRACLVFTAAVAAPAVLADAAQDRQAVALLLVASVAARTLVSVSIDECTARFAKLVEPALDAKMEWDARNAPLEDRARGLAGRLASGVDAATGASGYEAFRKSLLAQAQAEATGKVRETVTRDLAARPAAQRLDLCRDLVKAVHDGQMDFHVTQPNAYRILENAK
jgi:hypothetical protein